MYKPHPQLLTLKKKKNEARVASIASGTEELRKKQKQNKKHRFVSPSWFRIDPLCLYSCVLNMLLKTACAHMHAAKLVLVTVWHNHRQYTHAEVRSLAVCDSCAFQWENPLFVHAPENWRVWHFVCQFEDHTNVVIIENTMVGRQCTHYTLILLCWMQRARTIPIVKLAFLCMLIFPDRALAQLLYVIWQCG